MLSFAGCLSSFGCYLHKQRALTTWESVCNHTWGHARTPAYTSHKVNGYLSHSGTNHMPRATYGAPINGPAGVCGLPCSPTWSYFFYFPINPSNRLSITIPPRMNESQVIHFTLPSHLAFLLPILLSLGFSFVLFSISPSFLHSPFLPYFHCGFVYPNISSNCATSKAEQNGFSMVC